MSYAYVNSKGEISPLDPATTPPTEAAKKGLRRVLRPEEPEAVEYNALLDAAVRGKEQDSLMPRALREFLLAQPSADKQPWYARVKAVDADIATLRSKRK